MRGCRLNSGDAVRNDLNHPNEFVRGTALRFVSRLTEIELIEPLLPSVRANLDHRHSYVRRAAALAVCNVCTHSPELLPDGAELMEVQLHHFSCLFVWLSQSTGYVGGRDGSVCSEECAFDVDDVCSSLVTCDLALTECGCSCDEERAISFALGMVDQVWNQWSGVWRWYRWSYSSAKVAAAGEHVQLLFLDLVKRVCSENPLAVSKVCQ